MPADTRRPETYTYVPPPVGTEPSATVVRTSAEVCETEPRWEPVLLPGPTVSVAVPGVTDWRLPPEVAVHAPPTSAVPRPPETVRPNASAAITAGSTGPGGGVSSATVTERVVVAVAPSSSVTVRVTGYVPATPKVCDAVTPVAVPPSPKVQAYERTVPSGSVEPDPSTATDSPLGVAVAAAVGARFGAGGSTPPAPGAVTVRPGTRTAVATVLLAGR